MSAWFLTAMNSFLPLLLQALVLDPTLSCLSSGILLKYVNRDRKHKCTKHFWMTEVGKNLIQSVYGKIQSRVFSYQPACNSGQAQTTIDLFPLLSRAPPTPESKGKAKSQHCTVKV